MKDCLFCKIIAGEIPGKKIYEDDDIYAFHDIAPQGPVHFLVVPKKHIRNMMELEEGDSPLIGKLLFKAQEILAAQGCGERGGRFVINCKSDGMQTVDHIHVHVIGGRSLGWPPG
ncbi:MAG: histidine triad nucleotide-binding protein [Treponema sp.]|jgi:histidine triad (HIT) family protein|nr:histidine triad nucleotide-binding protein [Treponema sp.]